ncbi:hypothetical protein C1646_448330 [Rhizophagus diaphanus]|nr:hypothetical protein C1646_448330 [Rhizophagus diaphanus] [Rhizophagus sp. MUCL 43196]
MSTMPESANLMPFVCKWLYYHSEPQQFETQEKLINHTDKHDINSCNRSSLRDPIYICPWEGCNKHQSSIIKLEEHLHRHIRQRPFKVISKNIYLFFFCKHKGDRVELSYI